MSSPSNPSPRRNRSSAPAPAAPPAGRASKPRSTSRLDERTVDMTAPRSAAPRAPRAAPKTAASSDPGTKRRALKKKRARQSNFLAWTVAAAVSVMIGGAAAGVWSEYQHAQGRVSQKRALLADLKTQLEIGRKRLSALTSSSGKERVLVENGYLKPGERLLLFPKTTPKPGAKSGG